MRNYLLLLALSALIGCSHSLRKPNQVSFSEVERKIQSEIALDQTLVQNPQHATQLYSHGRYTEKSILIMHGLHESPHYMRGLSEHFFNKGYNVLSLRLPSHMSKTTDDLNSVKAIEWIEAAEYAFEQTKQLGQQVEILGYSLGGSLGMYLALKNENQIGALYLIAPALALSNQVFAASTFAGWANIDLLKMCDPVANKKLLCKIILHADDQIRILLTEKIMPSAAAGFQVQNTINYITQHFSPNNAGGVYRRDYYNDLKETYLKLQVPLVMINSELDNVIYEKFNSDFMKVYKGPKVNLLFKKQLGVTHLKINKSLKDSFQNTRQIYNPYFNEMIQAIDSLQK